MSALEVITEIPRNVIKNFVNIFERFYNPKSIETKKIKQIQIPYISELNQIYTLFEQTSNEVNFNKIKQNLIETGLADRLEISLNKKEYDFKLNKLKEGVKFLEFILLKNNSMSKEEILNYIDSVHLEKENNHFAQTLEKSKKLLAKEYINLVEFYYI